MKFVMLVLAVNTVRETRLCSLKFQQRILEVKWQCYADVTCFHGMEENT
jgi:hypothetical protein